MFLLVFSCEFCEISKNTFSYRKPLVAASELYDNTVNSIKYLIFTTLRSFKKITRPCGWLKVWVESAVTSFFLIKFESFQLAIHPNHLLNAYLRGHLPFSLKWFLNNFHFWIVKNSHYSWNWLSLANLVYLPWFLNHSALRQNFLWHCL